MGKSTLCIEAINRDEITITYARISYVRLDTIVTPEEMLAKIRDTLGIIARESPLRQVIDELQRSSILLFLDNLEDCWWNRPKDTEDILSQLAQVKNSTFIVTLRGTESPLGPKWGARIDLPPLSCDDSRRLFISTSEKDESSMDADALDNIICSMDGIPLAIDLMGRRAQNDPLPELARQWARKRTDILRHGKNPDRVTSLDVCVEISLSDPRMDKESMRLLTILGMLPMGLENDDLEAILPETGMEAKHKLLTTGIAIRKEIRAGTTINHAEGIRLLSPVRLYIEDKHPPADRDRSHVLSHFLNIANEATKIGWEDGENIQEMLSRKSASVDSLLQRQLSSENRDNALCAVRVAIAYGRYQRFAGAGTDNLLAQAAGVANNLKDRLLEAGCHLALGSMKVMRSLPAEARAEFEKAKGLYSALSATLGIAHCLRGLGDVARVTYQYGDASAYYKDAIKHYGDEKRNTADAKTAQEIDRGIADCQFRLGTIIQDSTLSHDDAERDYTAALSIHKRIGDVLGQAHCLKRLADVAMSKYPDNAEERYRDANNLYRKVPYLIGMADCAYSLGDLYLRQGRDVNAAEVFYKDANDLYVRASSDHGKANCKYSLADIDLYRAGVLRHEGKKVRTRLEEIGDQYESIKSLYENLRDDVGKANCYSGLSDIKRLQGDEPEAERLFQLGV